MIRIAAGSAYWGDWPQAPGLQVRSGPIDYLVLDYLAEVTISILDKQKRRDPNAGYATDFVRDIGDLLPEIRERGVKVIASAGGVHPRGCAETLLEHARAAGIRGLRIGVVSGDDVLDALRGQSGGPIDIRPLESDALPFSAIAPRVGSAHVYFGARPIADALGQGAQIVVTGRCTDTALSIGPMVHELGIAEDDWDALALGTVVGHILECGAQSSGGNFLGDWRAVPRPEALGFPIAEIRSREEAVITKHESLGGLVSQATVKEQLLYEIGDPRAYMGADCIADFTTIALADAGKDRVRISGVRGRPAPPTLKVSCVCDAGWKVAGELTFCWPEAVARARAAAEILRARCERSIPAKISEWRFELIGWNACHGDLTPGDREPQEVVLRISARSSDRAACDEVGREIIGLILTGPHGITGYAGGRPRATQVRSIWSGLIARDSVRPRVEILES